MTDSFEKVYDRVYPQLHNPCGMWKADVVKEWLDELMTAHDNEIEHLRKERFREGYEAGRRSMDAEHYAVALRLRQLPLEEDSHGNLSKLAYAIYPCATGWTCESCEGLRDRLVELLGGVSKPPTYDVLGNERHKAIAELRKLTINSDYYGNYQRVARAIGTEYDGKSLASECVRDRLIYLLGGDDGTCPNANKTCPNPVQRTSITDDGSDHEPAQGVESAMLIALVAIVIAGSRGE